MPYMEFKDLTKDEIDILYYFFKNKIMANAQKAILNDFLQFNEYVHDTQEIQTILDNLVKAGYLQSRFNLDNSEKKTFRFIPFSKLGTIEVEYGIKDRATYEILYKKFKTRIYIDKIKSFLMRLWNFLLQYIVTIIVSSVTSILTAYFTLRLFGK